MNYFQDLCLEDTRVRILCIVLEDSFQLHAPCNPSNPFDTCALIHRIRGPLALVCRDFARLMRSHPAIQTSLIELQKHRTCCIWWLYTERDFVNAFASHCLQLPACEAWYQGLRKNPRCRVAYFSAPQMVFLARMCITYGYNDLAVLVLANPVLIPHLLRLWNFAVEWGNVAIHTHLRLKVGQFRPMMPRILGWRYRSRDEETFSHPFPLVSVLP